MTDYISQVGAELHATEIRAYWLDKGYRVSTRVEQVVKGAKQEPCWAVKTDMVNGLPRGWRGPVVAATKPTTSHSAGFAI